MSSPDHMEKEDEDGTKMPPPPPKSPEENPQSEGGGGGGGWGGWGFSSFSVLSDLQKAAEEISRNAVEAAKSAAKGIADVPLAEEESAAATVEEVSSESESENENDKLRSSALDRMENASEDSIFGQGLKVIDSSVESFASGAWLALGNAWKGGSTLVHKLENSATNFADSIQQGVLPVNASSVAPSLIESGRSFTAKGFEVLERVSKETMDLLITESGLNVNNDHLGTDYQDREELSEEVTFDRCFYIYGGPDQLEELEALSNHYALLFNRRKVKLLSEQKSSYDGKLKQIQQIFSLDSDIDENVGDPGKGKNIETSDDANGNEVKILRDSSVNKAAKMATGFAAALGGLATNEIIQKTTDRLEIVHSEGVHRLSELCCFAVSHLLMLGKSIISNANKLKSEDSETDEVKIDWPEDSVSKAKIIRSKAQSMSGDVESVSNSFVTGISDIIEAYQAAIKSAAAGAHEDLQQQNSVQEKASTMSNQLRADQTTALRKIQDAVHYLAYVVLTTSMPTA